MAEEAKAVDTEQSIPKQDTQPAAGSGPVPTPGAQNAQAPVAPDLNVSDLNSVRSIIDIATQRGAFKANELEAVGKTYNKLTAFLDHVTKQQQANQEPKEENNG